MGCGQHFLEGLRLPPPERAAEIFLAAGSEKEGVQRLVDTIVDAFERKGQGWRPDGGSGPNSRCEHSGRALAGGAPHTGVSSVSRVFRSNSGAGALGTLGVA
jgi:hypothetical protein